MTTTIETVSTTTNGCGRPTWIRPRRIYRVTAVRTGIRTDHQLRCGTGSFDLNLILREIDERRSLSISGRVLTAGDEPRPAEGLTLSLVDEDGRPLDARSSANEFGEFQFTAAADDCCGLRLGDSPESPCVSIREERD